MTDETTSEAEAPALATVRYTGSREVDPETGATTGDPYIIGLPSDGTPVEVPAATAAAWVETGLAEAVDGSKQLVKTAAKEAAEAAEAAHVPTDESAPATGEESPE